MGMVHVRYVAPYVCMGRYLSVSIPYGYGSRDTSKRKTDRCTRVSIPYGYGSPTPKPTPTAVPVVSIPYGYGSQGRIKIHPGEWQHIHVSIPYGYGSQPPLLCGRHMIPHFPAKNHPNFWSVQRAPAQYEIIKTKFWEPDLASINDFTVLVILIDRNFKLCKRFLLGKIWSVSFWRVQWLQLYSNSENNYTVFRPFQIDWLVFVSFSLCIDWNLSVFFLGIVRGCLDT